MIMGKLTSALRTARSGQQTANGGRMVQDDGAGAMNRASLAGLVLAAVPVLGGLSGCVNVAAPDKPIVIELNINIRQEVIYRLNADAANTIDDNPEIF